MKPSKEQIEQFRAAVIEELKKMPPYEGLNPPTYDLEIEVMKNRTDDVLINAMEFNTPKEYAEMLTM